MTRTITKINYKIVCIIYINLEVNLFQINLLCRSKFPIL